MSILNYLEKVNKHYQSGHATEHTYRGDFAELIYSLVPDIHITNEPSNVTDCGNPDYVITNNKIPVGFIEAKDLGKDLNSKQYKEQFGRYRKALDNLIITDYIYFQFYQNGNLIHEISIAEINGKQISSLPENFDQFTNLIRDFCTFIAQTIKSSQTLAKMMAAKARLLENILEAAITSDEENEENTALKQQYETFKDILIHDLTPKGFADIYAQTLAYGMFAARLHDKTLETFSRQEAAELIPKSNPFLRKLFSHVAGVDIDERIVTTVDNLADVYRATDVDALLKNFGKSTQTHDPIIHFYETFLAEYDPKLRKARGVWYTPEPVVNFIVRAVDDVLKTEFSLKDGLADTSKTTIEVEVQGTAVTKGKGKGMRLKETKEVHKVQVLDPATGTGTFLTEVVKYIYKNKFQSMQGAWSSYIEEHLIPRLNGFELLMASYSMAHLKLDMLLSETGYKSKNNPRFNVFLTNSLEEYHPDTGTLFSTWLSTEANEANNVKRDSPVMVVMGNPPYSISSTNKGEWILDLISDYKKGLNEKKINLDDDYIKFIRYGQYYVEKNGEGILAFITNNSFIDGLTHRKMREDLLKAFDSIYIVDLHGNSKREEKAKDGSKDENVFDIMQGVSINIFVKSKESSAINLAEIFHHDLLGLRKDKYHFLQKNSISSIDWNKLNPCGPNYFFVPKQFKGKKSYDSGFNIKDIFLTSGNGIGTDRDKLFYDFDKNNIEKRFKILLSDEGLEDGFAEKYNVKSSSSYDLSGKRSRTTYSANHIKKSLYRPFDKRWTYYDRDLVSRPAFDVMKNFIPDENIGLLVTRQLSTGSFQHAFITSSIVDRDPLSVATRERTQVFPLYIESKSSEFMERLPNLKPDFIKSFSESVDLEFISEKSEDKTNKISPYDILDYIYAILHAPKYRAKYLEFLIIDFPSIPFPKNPEIYIKLKRLGEKLRGIHLLEDGLCEDPISSFPENGNNTISNKIVKKDWELYDEDNGLGRIWINKEQYFDGIPDYVWGFYIGNYTPAQKWLKDRTGRKLSFDEIIHYQKIITALNQTNKIMQEIDSVDFL
jgi:predicted helicase